MRFALEHTVGQGGIESTVLLNLSETGVAFLVAPGHVPKLGDRIKVEIPVPSGDQIAWWGRVVRAQEYEPRSWFFGKDPFLDDPRILIGVRFEQLPGQHTKTIRKGIENSFIRAMRDQQYRTWLYYRALFMQNMFKIVMMVLLTAGCIGLIWWLTLPSGNYDSQHGAPWGERFKF